MVVLRAQAGSKVGRTGAKIFKFEGQFRTILCKDPFSNALLSKFLTCIPQTHTVATKMMNVELIPSRYLVAFAFVTRDIDIGTDDLSQSCLHVNRSSQMHMW